MFETLQYYLTPAAPVLIGLAAFLDTFIGTGYVLYGFALLTAIGMMHMDGLVTVPEILFSASLGTIAASTTNFALGYWFGHTAWVQRKLKTAPMRRLQQYLDRWGNWWFIVIGRSVTLFRPSYALLLGLMHRPWRRFLGYEIPIAIIWVCFWLTVILFGESLIERII